MARAAKAAGVRARDLVDARGHARVHPARATTACRRSASATRCPTTTRRARPTSCSPTRACPSTFLQTSFYWENFIYFGMGPQRGEDGALSLTFPIGDGRVAGIAAEDIGACAYGIFKGGAPFIGKTVSIAGEHLTGERDGGGVQRRARRDGDLQRGHARGLPRLRLPRAPTTSATCSSSRPSSRTSTAACATSTRRAASTRRCKTLPSSGSRRTRSASPS